MRVSVYSDGAFERWRSAQNGKSCGWEKYSLIPLREKSRGVSGKTFLHLEESPFCPNGRSCVCAGRRWLWKIKSGMKRTQKDPSYLQRKIWGGVSGKTFCVLSKSVLCPNRHRCFCAGGRGRAWQTTKQGHRLSFGDVPYLCLMRRNFWGGGACKKHWLFGTNSQCFLPTHPPQKLRRIRQR